MIDKFIDEIRENIDFLYEKYDLFVEAIEVSSFLYIEIQRNILQLIEKNICVFHYTEPLQIDNIPIVINKDLNNYGYKLLVSIPSYKFNYKN